MVPRFDLVEIVKTLHKRLRFIVAVSVAAALISAVVFLVRKKNYKAKTEFFVANPLYMDRTNLFRSDYSQFIDYFGKEDDADKVLAIAKSDSLQMRVIRKLHLDQVYHKNMDNPKELMKLMEQFDGNYEIKRTEYTSLEVSYTDDDAKRASEVANEIVNSIAEMYTGYFANLRGQVMKTIENKVKETDLKITLLTDSLATLRDRYQIYDLISPARKNIITGTMRSSGGAGFGRAIEEIQNIESVKDQLVIDRAGYISVIDEFSTGVKAGTLPLIQTLTLAKAPYKPAGFGLVVTTIIAGLAGLFFVCLWVLLTTYFRALLNTER